MIKILAIGNSFSEDATAYLHDIARAGGIESKVVNLYIGGCPLSLHAENIRNDAADYQYQLNGVFNGKMVSIKEALLEENWDFVTLQQASPDSGIAESYYPFITEVSHYVQSIVPDAVQFIHETWAYETDSDHDQFYRYHNSQEEMYHALRAAYQKASDVTGLPLIPCGEVIQKVRGFKEFDYANGGQSLCRDGFHMHMAYGRYLTAAVWYETILKGNIMENGYLPADCDPKRIERIKTAVHESCGK